ncbi:DNA-binding protein [Streptomyces inhibens]|uniref:DNA-binding protein n=1 Tax=Streptomyces inhibens TaxID=2293571 RepID=A0A371Q2R7_STRIH|nr:DNA-binding protein [Streptomyces inhibens]
MPPQIGAPARRALERAGYLRLSQLAGASETELRQLHGMGPKALGILRDALAAQGMSFAEE